MSGILQQGYSFGYVLAACANLGVGGATNTWKTLFWIGGMISWHHGSHALFCKKKKNSIRGQQY